jgi:hypothetical protein
MSGGVISGNSASNYGGGVYVNGSSTSGSFSKTGGGVIYGSNADASLKNNAWDNTYGHGVYYSSGNGYYRDTTLNAGDNISTAALPGSGTGDNWTKK